MTGVGQTRSFGDVGSMSGLPESGHGWALLSTRPSAANWHIRRERQESTLGEI
jgi:hypothetical protein